MRSSRPKALQKLAGRPLLGHILQTLKRLNAARIHVVIGQEAGLLKVTSTLAEIKRMRVHPLFQGRGHGQAILDALQARAVEMGYTKLCLDTTVQQIAAPKLYLKNGFLEVGRTQKGRFECLLFEKQIKPISRPHPTELR